MSKQSTSSDRESGTQTIPDKMKQFTASPAGIFIYAATTGIIGVIILLAFLSMILAPNGLLLVLPAIVGFNSAASAFSLRDKNEKRPGKISYCLLAALLTVTGGTAIIFFCPWEELLDGTRFFLSGVSALIFSAVGAWIAGKNKTIKAAHCK